MAEMDERLTRIESRLTQLLRIVQLEEFRHSYPGQLSGGMKHRVALARSLFLLPELLLLDEPLAGLDLLTRRDLMVQLEGVLHEAECSTIVVTHSVEEAVFWGDRIVLLSHRPARIVGVVEHGTAHPRLQGYTTDRHFHELVDQCADAMLRLRGGDV